MFPEQERLGRSCSQEAHKARSSSPSHCLSTSAVVKASGEQQRRCETGGGGVKGPGLGCGVRVRTQDTCIIRLTRTKTKAGNIELMSGEGVAYYVYDGENYNAVIRKVCR